MSEPAALFVLGSFVVACSAKVERLPRPGESLTAEAFVVEAGGKGLNLAVGARRLGAEVDGLLAVGNDFFAGLAEPALVRAGLPPSMLVHYETTTGSGIGFTDADGENCLAVYPGANLRLGAGDVRAASAALTQAGMVLAQFEIGDEPILEAFRLAREAGRQTLLNPSPVRALHPDILARTSVLVLNRVEAHHLCEACGSALPASGAEPVASFRPLAAVLLDRGPDAVVVTLGAGGAFAYRRGEEPLHQRAFPVQAIDSLGAGDAFTAGLATSLAEGQAWPECLRRAAACGAIATQRLGVFDALPTRAALDAFLETPSEFPALHKS